jgi:hypothetical protein
MAGFQSVPSLLHTPKCVCVNLPQKTGYVCESYVLYIDGGRDATRIPRPFKKVFILFF